MLPINNTQGGYLLDILADCHEKLKKAKLAIDKRDTMMTLVHLQAISQATQLAATRLATETNDDG